MGLLQYMLIATIGTGTTFGELGLIYNRQRAASTIALGEIELGVLEKADFNRAFAKFFKSEESQKRTFIEKYIITKTELKYLAPKIGVMFKKHNF